MSLHKQTGWQVGDTFFDNKWDAVQYATDNPQYGYKAYCNDDTWDIADWTVEPKEDIKELQKNHAEQLREKYKVLALNFSGGLDSSTVLHTFIENKIPLDYIVNWYHPDDLLAPYNKDALLAIQYLQENKEKLLGAKVIFGSKPDHFEGNAIYNFKKPIRNANFQLRFHHIGYEEVMELRHPKILDEIKENGCFLMGSNKPSVYQDENGFYMQMVDVEDESWTEGLVERFWLGSDPTLMIKQCHLAKQWLKSKNLSSTNEVYKNTDSDEFWQLNQSFGRISIHEFFQKKPVFGSYVSDENFSQHYGYIWGTKYYADFFEQWRYSQSYNDLKQELEKIDKRFCENHKLHGWFAEKRYIE